MTPVEIFNYVANANCVKLFFVNWDIIVHAQIC